MSQTFDISDFDDESIVVGQTNTLFLITLSGTLAIAIVSFIISKILNKRQKEQTSNQLLFNSNSNHNSNNNNNTRNKKNNHHDTSTTMEIGNFGAKNSFEKNNPLDAYYRSDNGNDDNGDDDEGRLVHRRKINARSNRFSELSFDSFPEQRRMESDDEFLMRGASSSPFKRRSMNSTNSSGIIAYSETDGFNDGVSITNLFAQKKIIDEKVCDIHEEFESKLVAAVERDSKNIKEVLLETLGEQEVCVQQLNELMENVRLGYQTSLWSIIEELARNVVKLRKKFEKLKKDYSELEKGLYDYFTQEITIILQASRENHSNFEVISWKLKEKGLELERSLVYLEEKDKEISKLKYLLEKKEQDLSQLNKDHTHELFSKESKINELSQELKEKNSLLLKSFSDIENLKSELHEKNKENNRITKDLEEASKNAQDYQYKFSQVMQENNTLKNDLNNMKYSLENTGKEVYASVDIARNVELQLSNIKQELENSKLENNKLDRANENLRKTLEENEKKISELTNKSIELEESNNSLRNKINISLSADLERLEKELRAAESEKEQIQEEKEQAEASLNKSKYQVKEYEEEIREKTKKVNELEIELAKAIKSNEFDKKEIEQLVEQIEILKKQIKDLSIKLSQSDFSKMEVENLLNSSSIALGNEKKENESLRTSIKKLEDKILNLQSKIDKYKEDINQMEDEIFRKDNLIKQLSQKLETHEKQNELLSEKFSKELAEKEKQNMDISNLNASKVSIHQSLSEKLASCEEQSTSMKEQLESLKSKVEVLKNAVKVKKGKIHSLKEQVENLDEQKRTLESNHNDELLKLNASILIDKQTIESLKSKINQSELLIDELTQKLKQEKNAYQNEKQQLDQSLNLKLKVKDDEISNLLSKISIMEKDLLTTKEVHQNQDVKITELKKLKEQADISKQSIQDELEKQKEKTNTVQRDCMQLKKELGLEKDISNKLSENLNVLKIQIQSIETKLEEKDKSISLSNQNCKTLEQELSKLRETLHEKTKHLDTQTKFIEDVYKKLKVLVPEDLKLQESEIGYMVLEIIETVRQRENKLLAESERLNSILQQLKSQLDTRDNQIITSKEKRRKLKASIQELTQDHKQEVEKLKLKLQENNQQLTTLESSNSEKSSTIKQIQDELNNLKTTESNLSSKVQHFNILLNQQKASLEQSEHSAQSKDTIITSLKRTIENMNQSMLELESKASKFEMEKNLLDHNMQILKSSNTHLAEDAKTNSTMFQELQQKHRQTEKELFHTKLDLESERESKLVLEQKFSMLVVYKKQVEQFQEELAKQQHDSEDTKKKLEHGIAEREKRIKTLEEEISRFSDLNTTKETAQMEELRKRSNEIQQLNAKLFVSEKNLSDFKEEVLYEKKKLQDRLDILIKENSELKESELKLSTRIEEQRKETKKKLEDLENEYQVQIENYISQLKNFEHTDSQHENKNLKEQAKEMMKEIEELTKRMSEKVICENCLAMKKQLEEIEILHQREINELNQKISITEKEKSSLDNELDKFKKQMNSLEQEKNELEGELESLKSKIKDKQQHILDLENENDKLVNEHRKKTKELESEKVTAEQQLQDSLDNCNSLTKKLQDKDIELENCKQNIDSNENSISKLQQDIKQLNKDKFDQESALLESKNEISRLEHLLKKTQLEFEQKLNESDTKHSGESQKITELEKEISKISAEFKNAEDHSNNTISELKQKLKLKISESENLEQEIAKSTKDYKNATQEIEHLSADLDRKNKLITELEEEKETLRKEKSKIISKLEDDLSAKESDIKKVQHQMEDMELQIENLQKRHREELKSETQKIQETEHKLVDLQNNLENEKRFHKDLQDDLNSSKEKEQVLTENNTHLKHAHEKLQKELLNVQSMLAEEKDKEEKKGKEIEDLHLQLTNSKSNEKRLELEIDNLNRRIQQSNTQRDELSDEVSQLSKNVTMLKLEKKTIQEELDSKIEENEKCVHNLEKEKRVSEEKIAEILDQCKQYLTQLENLKEKEKTINSNLQISNLNITKLEEENQHLKTQISLQNGKLSDCESNCKTLETDLKEKIEKLQKENESLSKIIGEKQNKLNNMAEEKRRKQTDIENFENDNQNLTKELDILKEREQELQKTLQEETLQRNELSENFVKATKNCEELQNTIQDKEKTLQDLSEKNKFLTETTNTLSERISLLEKEKSEMDEHFSNTNSNLHDLLKQLETLKEQLQEQTSSHEHFAKESQENQNQLESSIQQLKHSNDLKQSEIDSLIKGNEALVEQIKNQKISYEEELNSLEEERKRVSEKNQKEQQKVRELESSLKDLRQQYNEKDTLLEQANETLAAEKSKSENLSNQLNLKNTEIESLKTQMQENNQELDHETKELKESKDREEKLKQDVEALQSTIQNLEIKNQELTINIKTLSDNNIDMQQKLLDLKSSLEPLVAGEINKISSLEKTYQEKIDIQMKRIEELTKKLAKLKAKQPVKEEPKTPKKELPPKENDPTWKFMKLMEEAGFEFSDETYEKMRGKSIFSLLRTGKKLNSENKEDFYSEELEFAEKALSKWLQRLAGTEYDQSISLFKNLLDGVILCKYANTLFPETEPCKKFVEGTTNTQAAIGNVSMYTNFCKLVGITSLFEYDYLLKASSLTEQNTTKERSSIVSNLALLFEFSVKCSAQPEMRTQTLKKLQSSIQALPLESPSRPLLSSRTRSIGSMSFSKAQLSSIIPSTPENFDGSITDRQANIEGMMSSRTHYYQKATNSQKILEEDEEKYFKETLLQITERKDDGKSLLKIVDDGTVLCMIIEKYYGKVIKYKNQPNKFQKNDNHQAFIAAVHKIVKNTQRFTYTHDEIEKGNTKPLYALLKLFFEELEKNGKLKFSTDDSNLSTPSAPNSKGELDRFKEKIAMIDKSEGYSSPSTPTSVDRMYQQPSPINNFKLSDSKILSAIVNPNKMTPPMPSSKQVEVPSTINTQDMKRNDEQQKIPTITKEIFFTALSRRGSNGDEPPVSARLLSPTPRSSRFHVDPSNFTNKVADTIYSSVNTSSPRRHRRSFISSTAPPRSPTTPKVNSPPNPTFFTPRLTADNDLCSDATDIFEDLIDDLGVITTDETFELLPYFKQAGSYITEDEQKEDFLKAIKKTPSSLNFTGCEQFIDSIDYTLIIQNLRNNKKIKSLTFSGSPHTVGVNLLIDWLKNKNNTPSLKKLVLIGWKEIDSLHKVCSERGISLVLE